MLWRVRTTLPDRPGALAVLAQQCGAAGVNILGLQIFPGVEAVTDELVLRTPEDWGLADDRRRWSSAPGGDVGQRDAVHRGRRWSTSRPATCRPPARSWPSRPPSPRSSAGSSTPRPSRSRAPGAGAGRDGDDRRRRRRSRSAATRRSPPPSTPAARRWPPWSPTSSPAAAPSPRAQRRPPGRRVGSGAAPTYVASTAPVAALGRRAPWSGVARLAGRTAEEAGRSPVDAAASTRPGSAAASAPGCWSTRPARRRLGRRRDRADAPARTTRRCCRWCSPPGCAAGSGWPATS